MGKGFLKIQLFSAQSVMPVYGGNIFVLESTAADFEDGKVLTTDECGVSKIITVNTPDKSVGENPTAKDIPYSSYDIYIRAKGFRDVAIEGIQVFPDVVSVQRVEMIPTKKERAFMEEAEASFIPPHQLLLFNLRNKIEGAKVTGTSNILSEMPASITVHLGPPTSYAENVTLDFIEYIKNVASSEIYPIWHEEALKANIYAEISFALNRLQTGWYRDKGYAFDITSCVSYDQAFVKGRNIYDNISKIVDEVFGEYIEDREIKGAILTNSCNGITTTCNGLSQWGTVALANNGSKALDILKNYYGNEIILAKTIDIKGLEQQYEGIKLKVGSTGKSVENIQNKLNKISENYTAINKCAGALGEFEESTSKAVKKFQEIFNINVSGEVDRITWYKIFVIYNGIKKLLELKEESNMEHNTGVSPEYLLRYGDSGSAVREFQCYLAVISQYYSIIPQIKINGEFDLNTKAAVLAFQKKFNNIDVDGIVGKQTWEKIYQVYCDLR